jgi:hypothetical protein
MWIIIKTSDTDEIVLCIYFDKQMTNTSEMWVQMGNISSVKDGRRFLPIHDLCSEVVLPDRKYAKLWSGMRHEEYAASEGSNLTRLASRPVSLLML